MSLSVQPDGGCRITGTRNGRNAQWFAPELSVEQSGIVPGRTYSLSLIGADKTRTVAGIYGYDSDGAAVLNVSTSNGDRTLSISGDVKKLLFRIHSLTSGAGEQMDETVYPMLVEGMPADYVPYALGGGQVLTNLWLDSGKLNNPDGLTVTRLDDGGYRIKGQTAAKWHKIMLATLPIGDLGLSSGDKFSISWGDVPPYAGGLELYVSQQDASMKKLHATTQEGQKVVTIVPGTAYITCVIGTSGTSAPIDCTVYPMLVKSDAPVDYYVPYEVGGGRP